MTGFVFNRSYSDLGQVEEFFPAYMAVYEELKAAGQYPYNASFVGRIPGIEGPSEETAIYLLQGLRRQRELEAKVEAMLAQGYEWVEEISGVEKFARIALIPAGRMDGEYQVFTEARLVARPGETKPYGVLPKGKRTRGALVSGRRVLAKRGATA